jgi:two-component system, OmpR family, KDP operon response regulator KdpE
VQRPSRTGSAPTRLERLPSFAHGEETLDLRLHVVHIRRELERDPAYPEILLTDAGVGYHLAPEP